MSKVMSLALPDDHLNSSCVRVWSSPLNCCSSRNYGSFVNFDCATSCLYCIYGCFNMLGSSISWLQSTLSITDRYYL